MDNALLEIMTSKIKHKEKVAIMAKLAVNDEEALAQLFDILQNGTNVHKGTAAEVMKFVSKENPGCMLPYIDTLIEYIDYKAPRVRWGCPEAIGNMASKYPHEVGGAIPKLLKNLEDESTVVRWCAAFALTEIAKYNIQRQEELVGIFLKLIPEEQNNGVRNVYLKALKFLDR
jgi:HEAT repeat protein